MQHICFTLILNQPSTLVRLVPNIEYLSLFMVKLFQLRSVFTSVYKDKVIAEAAMSDLSGSSASYLYLRIDLNVAFDLKPVYFLNAMLPMTMKKHCRWQ